MRIYEGAYAYEIERIVDPRTQLVSGWRYKVYRIRPVEDLLSTGQTSSRSEAEQAGKDALAKFVKEERSTDTDVQHIA